MKVFFHAYLRSNDKYLDFDKKIYDIIKDLGYIHTNETFQNDPKAQLAKIEKGGYEERVDLYKFYIKNIKSADIVVLDISMHSLASGFLLHEALRDEKPVLALYHEGNDPSFTININNEKLQLIEYNLSNLKEQLVRGLDLAKRLVDIRFNFFIPPEIITYLDYITNSKRISKSTYIRNLIMRDMAKNKEYRKTK